MEVETKPKVLPVDVWEKLIKKYRHLNLKTWRGMDCLQKANLIHIHFPDFPVYPIFKMDPTGPSGYPFRGYSNQPFRLSSDCQCVLW